MPTYSIYQVDAFANEVFSGNPAAVVPLDAWLPDEVMQNIALENNLSETAFIIKKEDEYEIRWFTPSVEVDLCGHATLASAFIIFEFLESALKVALFRSPHSGELSVEKQGERLTLNFPSDICQKVELPDTLAEAFQYTPLATYKGKTDYLLLFENQRQIETLMVNFALLAQTDVRGVIATAPGNSIDFVSRFFAPGSGIDEDPVTGSAHTTLTPFWSARLEKKELIARQLSARGGTIYCEDLGERVKLGGSAKLYMKGEIYI